MKFNFSLLKKSFFSDFLLTKKFSLLKLLVVIFIILVSCNSIFNYTGIKVDEGEIIYYAIGFFGGDLNPHWFGYGSFPMYILSLVYFLLYIPLWILGFFGDLSEYAQLAFNSSYFVIVARIFFCAIYIITHYLYYKSLRLLSVNFYLAISFFIWSVLSFDFNYYSDYIRTDVFVSLFVSCYIFQYVKFNQSKLSELSFVITSAIILGCCYTSKLTSITLIALIPLHIALNLLKEKKIPNLKRWLILPILIFLTVTFITQPFGGYVFDLFRFLNLSGSQNITSPLLENAVSLSSKLNENFSFIIKAVPKPYLLILFLCPIIGFKNFKLLILLIVVFILLLIPSLMSIRPRDYWLIPIFPMLRFTIFLSLSELLNRIIDKSFIALKLIVYGIYITIVLWLFLFNQLVVFAGQNNVFYNSKSDKQDALNWINENLIGKENILLDEHIWTIPPVMTSDVEESKKISTIFSFEKNNNKFLNDIYEEYHSKTFEHIGSFELKIYRVYFYLRDKYMDLDNCNLYNGYYFISNQIIYNRYLKSSFDGLNEEQIKKKQSIIEAYKCLYDNEVVKQFGDIKIIKISEFNINNIDVE